jgi:hypothetical protein
VDFHGKDRSLRRARNLGNGNPECKRRGAASPFSYSRTFAAASGKASFALGE